MSDCCASNAGETCSVPERGEALCPKCAAKGKSIATITVKSLVRDHTRVSADALYRFCRAPQCDVVYFSHADVFVKADLKVRVGIKEEEDPIPLCYCFGYDREDMRRDIESQGMGDIPALIKAEVQGGFCACEVKNPSGSCCLGDITRAKQEATALAATSGDGS